MSTTRPLTYYQKAMLAAIGRHPMMGTPDLTKHMGWSKGRTENVLGTLYSRGFLIRHYPLRGTASTMAIRWVVRAPAAE